MWICELKGSGPLGLLSMALEHGGHDTLPRDGAMRCDGMPGWNHGLICVPMGDGCRKHDQFHAPVNSVSAMRHGAMRHGTVQTFRYITFWRCDTMRCDCCIAAMRCDTMRFHRRCDAGRCDTDSDDARVQVMSRDISRAMIEAHWGLSGPRWSPLAPRGH
jgi:hypothetical protein